MAARVNEKRSMVQAWSRSALLPDVKIWLHICGSSFIPPDGPKLQSHCLYTVAGPAIDILGSCLHTLRQITSSSVCTCHQRRCVFSEAAKVRRADHFRRTSVSTWQTVCLPCEPKWPVRLASAKIPGWRKFAAVSSTLAKGDTSKGCASSVQQAWKVRREGFRGLGSSQTSSSEDRWFLDFIPAAGGSSTRGEGDVLAWHVAAKKMRCR
ncbi:unnamed protein product [Polarella glacialis]|uniref:Uncharacterized protein n=1 Tax=Polarella glacialis TaxID=89957 RepID=A0A813HB24_POLGL|nr:unnamed protein product [Polarella glacialis]CAE8719812.1 unnamed protein product [Polarella glacialis]